MPGARPRFWARKRIDSQRRALPRTGKVVHFMSNRGFLYDVFANVGTRSFTADG